MSRKHIKNLALSAVLILSMTALSACSKNEEKSEPSAELDLKTITTEELQTKLEDNSWVVVDTRQNDAYNGWALDCVKRGGHIEGAVDFSANWLDVDSDRKDEVLDEALKTKGIDSNKNIVLYDANGEDAESVANYLNEKGYNKLYTYNVNEWAKDGALPMASYKNYNMIVPPQVVKEVLDGKTPETFKNAKNIKIVEASWGEESEAYSKGHIPTSVHINTDTVEPPPNWLLASDEELAKFASDYGFNVDDTIIVTGPDTMAAYRVAVILRYMGVSDVRVLNGGNDAWVLAGYELETKSNAKTTSDNFGATIPANPDIITTIPELKEELKSDNSVLVDNRSWDEHIGKISGYSYIKAKGRIPGSLYGYAGIDNNGATSMSYYRNIDNTMRNADEIMDLWKSQDIDPSKKLMFMCGTGWRAAEVLTYANVIGLDNASLYSDGWMGWSMDTSNPIETGEPK